MELSSPFGKLAHAMRHIHELGDLQREYRDSLPVEYRQFGNLDDPSSPVLAMQWRVRKFQPLDATWSYVSGDAINNMRSALDHAMLTTIARFRELTPDDESKVFFPIHTEQKKWEKWKRQNAGYLDEAAMAAIETAQPLQEADGPELPLELLRRLSNIDKHRRLLTHTMSKPNVSVTVTPQLETIDERFTSEPMREDLTLATVKFKRPSNLGYVDIHLNVEFYEVIGLENGVNLPIAFTMHVMFMDAFSAVAELMAPIANDFDRFFVRSVLDAEEDNLRIVMRSFLNDEAFTALEQAAVSNSSSARSETAATSSTR